MHLRSAIQYLIAGVLMSGACAAQADIAGTVAFASDYRFRGISQTDESIAVQGSLTYTHAPSGFYVGAWGSNVDFQIQAEDDAQTEIDLFGGVSGEFSAGVGWDLGIIYYAYPNSDSALNYEFGEGYAGLKYKFLSAKYYYSPDFFLETNDAHYFDLGATLEVAPNINLVAHLGGQFIDDEDTFGAPDYIDWKIGASTQVAGLGVELAYVDTDLDDEECFSGLDWCDATAVLTVSKSF